jgi:alpha-amylase
VHQPYRLRRYPVFDVGNNHHYFDDAKNKEIMDKVANKCYLPTNSTILELIRKFDGQFKVSYSLSGVFMDQLEEYAPNVLESFAELAKTGCVEMLDETYYHSLAFLYSKNEFKAQVQKHNKKIRELFKLKPKIFRNTELIFNNEVANIVERMGYKGVLAEGADHVLGWRSPNFIYTPKTTSKIKLLLKNYKLSDDIAFRFSQESWEGHPLTAPKFADWVSAANGNGNVINLFMDYETFGEHQWADKGIFEFLKHMPGEILKHPDNNFLTLSEAIKTYNSVGELDIHHPVSWADVERDTSAWLGNRMQQEAIKQIYLMESMIKESKDKKLLEDWRRLQTSDHFYYMCTKWFNDGDVHKYFNPYDSPYDSFIAFMNIMNDIKIRLGK